MRLAREPIDENPINLIRFFLLAPVTAVFERVNLQIPHKRFHGLDLIGRDNHIIDRLDKKRRDSHCLIDVGRRFPVLRPVAIPVDWARKAASSEGIDVNSCLLGRQQGFAGKLGPCKRSGASKAI